MSTSAMSTPVTHTFRGKDQPVLQDRAPQGLDVVGYHVLPAPRGGQARAARWRARAAGDMPEREGGVAAGGGGQVDDVALEGRGHVDWLRATMLSMRPSGDGG